MGVSDDRKALEAVPVLSASPESARGSFVSYLNNDLLQLLWKQAPCVRARACGFQQNELSQASQTQRPQRATSETTGLKYCGKVAKLDPT